MTYVALIGLGVWGGFVLCILLLRWLTKEGDPR